MNSLPDVLVTTMPKSREKTQTRRVPPYNVILENDDHHSMDFVIDVLCKALGYSPERSNQLMLQAHNAGRAVVWTGSKEVAELKVERIRSIHQIIEPFGIDVGPLGCCIEPAPGSWEVTPMDQDLSSVVPKRPPDPVGENQAAVPYHIVLENDDHHTFEFVIAVLGHALGCPPDRAYELAMVVHTVGHAIVWTGTRKQAEVKLQLLRGYNEVRARDNAELGPIGCHLKPATGSDESIPS